MENNFKIIYVYIITESQKKRILLLKFSNVYLFASFPKYPMDF